LDAFTGVLKVLIAPDTIMKECLRVLLVEDAEDDATILLRDLKRGGFDPSWERVQTLATLISALNRSEWDVVISDHTMPGFDSLRALEVVKEQGLDIPFIVLSGTIGEDLAVKVMKAGASDYVMKSQQARLVPSIERELREAAIRRAKRRAEEALRRSEEELNDFFEHASVGLRWLGPDGVIARVNTAELEMLGYEHGEYVGQYIGNFFADQAVVKNYLERLHCGESVSDFEARLRCKNGAIKHVLINSNALREDGKFIHSRCFTRDITDRKMGEEAKAHLAAIVESSDDVIIGINMAGLIVSWNSGATRMYEYAAEEVKGLPISRLVPLYRPENWPEIYAEVRAGKKIERLETVRLRKDGSSAEVSVTLSPIRDEAGRVTGISAIERDISALRREEQERLTLISDLTSALAKVRTLSGLLPICASCKMIREGDGEWKKVETYISERTEAEFTHGLCPECLVKLYPEHTRNGSFGEGNERVR